jgi:transposase
MATDQQGIPPFLQTFSGNESDKKTLLTIISQLTKNLQHPGKAYHIADAAFYTAENLATLGTRTFWISRVPATLNEVKELIATGRVLRPGADERYQYAEQLSGYAGIPQKWVIYHSAPMQETAGEDVRKTAGERQEEGRNVATETRRTRVRLRTGCPGRCREVATGAPTIQFHLDGYSGDHPEDNEEMR